MKRFPISIYRWVDNDYTPEAWGELKLKENELFVKLTCIEKDPLARFTSYPDASVHKDSCLEFFFSVNDLQPRYINFEANAIGGYYCSYHVTRQDKTFITPFTENGSPKASILSDRWTVEATFDVREILKHFGADELDSIAVNFYKCGDETEFPHFGMWNEVKVAEPSFHEPAFFVNVPLEELK